MKNFVKYQYRAMRTAPPAAAALAPPIAKTHSARRALARARVPPCCAHTSAQVAIVALAINIHEVHNLLQLTLDGRMV